MEYGLMGGGRGPVPGFGAGQAVAGACGPGSLTFNEVFI
jgi:hypothetical protein